MLAPRTGTDGSIGPDVRNKLTLILLNKNSKIYESIILIVVNLTILASSINLLEPELYFTMVIGDDNITND